jgi:DNA-binding XRE family transcriptional regulator
MTPKQFKAWRSHMGLTKVAVAAMLHVTRQTPYLWESGKRPISKSVELACAALLLGVRDYPTERSDSQRSVQSNGTLGLVPEVIGVLAAPFSGPPGMPSS